MLSAEFAEVVQRGLEAAARGDFDGLRAVLHDEVTLTVGGRSLVAGEHRGREEVAGYFGRLRELSEGTWRIVGLDVGAAEDHVIAIYLAQAKRADRRLNSHEALVVELEEGRWKQCFLYFFDQYAFDEFWAGAGTED